MSKSTQPRTAELPLELLVDIFELLDVRTLLRCHLVCTMFHGIISDSPLLQYKIELEIAGLVDRPSVELPVTQRLELVKAHQAMFKGNMSMTTLWKIVFGKGYPFIYSGDVGFSLAHGKPEDSQFPSSIYDRVDVCHVQPTYATQDTPLRWWTIHSPHIFTSVCADPGQDLMVLYDSDMNSGGPDSNQLMIQVLSISSGEHLCPGGAFSLPLPDSTPGWQIFGVHIWGDVLAVVLGRFQHPELSITIIGWKDGLVRTHLVVPRPRHHGFHFVSRSTFLLEHRSVDESFGLHLYSYNPDATSTSDRPDRPPPKLMAIFQLPSLVSPDIRLWMSMAGSLTRRGAHNNPQNRRVFEVSPSCGVLIIHLLAQEDSHVLHNILIFIDPSLFRLYTFPPEPNTESIPTTIPWASWGPRNTRWFSGLNVRPSLGPRSYGSRALLPGRLLDFNSLDVARDLHHAQCTGEDQYSGVLVGRDTPKIIPAGPIFREDVVSELPYREIQYDFEDPVWDVCPGEDWVHR